MTVKDIAFATLLAVLPACAAAAPPPEPQPEAPKEAPAAEKAVPAAQSAYALLQATMGAEAIEILAERNVLVLSAGKDDRGVLYVHWPSIEALAARAEDLAALAQLYEKVRGGAPIEGDPASLRRVEAMQELGPVTAPVRSAAALLAAHIEQSSPAAAEDPARKPLPALPWGREFWSRIHGDILTDFQAAARLFFRDLLSGPQRSAPASEFFLSCAKAPEARAGLERDQAAGKPSQETLASLAACLAEQKRAWDLSLTRERLKAVEKDSSLSKDLKDISSLSARFLASPEIVGRLRDALDSKGPEPAIRFSGGDIHVHLSAGKEPFDVGDETAVSLAYWIDGAPAKASFEITEAGFLDEGGAGISEVTTSLVRRQSGGPHLVKLPLPLRSSGRKTYRSMLASGDGASANREISYDVSDKLDRVISAAAEAENAFQTCRLEEAELKYAELEAKLADSPDKPQFKAVGAWLKARPKRVSDARALLKTTLALLDGVRLHASKDLCDFKSDKARAALSLLDSLPAGCDRIAGSTETIRLRDEIEEMLRLTESRRANQDAFRLAAEKARRLEADCRYEEAEGAYASALALLDADPSARCGAWEAEFTRIRLHDLPRAASYRAFGQELASTQEKASGLASKTERNYAQALALATPLIARIDSSPVRDCYRDARRKAEDLAEFAGVSLGPGRPASAANESLPKDDLDSAVNAVLHERSRIDESEADRLKRESSRQEPSVLSSPEPASSEPSAGGQP